MGCDERGLRTVAGGVLLAVDEGLGMEKTPVRASLDFVNDIGLEVDVERPRHVFPRGRFGEEGAEAFVAGGGGTFFKAAIGLRNGASRAIADLKRRSATHAETVLNSVQLPCG